MPNTVYLVHLCAVAWTRPRLRQTVCVPCPVLAGTSANYPGAGGAAGLR